MGVSSLAQQTEIADPRIVPKDRTTGLKLRIGVSNLRGTVPGSPGIDLNRRITSCE